MTVQLLAAPLEPRGATQECLREDLNALGTMVTYLRQSLSVKAGNSAILQTGASCELSRMYPASLPLSASRAERRPASL